MDKGTIGNGRTADVTVYHDTYVLKLFKTFIDGASIDQEFNIALYAYKQCLPTPKPISQLTQNDRKGIVYEKIDGTSLLRQLSGNPLRLTKIAKAMARLHCKINAVEFDSDANKQKKKIEHAINATSLLREGDKQKILDYLSSLPDGKFLCHGDFHPDNVLVNDKLWIIDWMTGSSGNPSCDIARSKLILETSEIPDSVPPAMRYLMRFGQRKLAKAYFNEYCKISKAKVKDINAWLLPLYAARLVENLSAREETIVMKRIREEIGRLPKTPSN